MGVNYDFRCHSCGEMFIERVESGIKTATCPLCDGEARQVWVRAPGVIMRPDGWNLSPDDPRYSYLPKKDREIHTWQS